MMNTKAILKLATVALVGAASGVYGHGLHGGDGGNKVWCMLLNAAIVYIWQHFTLSSPGSIHVPIYIHDKPVHLRGKNFKFKLGSGSRGQYLYASVTDTALEVGCGLH